MNIDEYQAKAILADYAVRLPRGGIADSAEAVQAADIFIAPDAATIGETMRRALLS